MSDADFCVGTLSAPLSYLIELQLFEVGVLIVMAFDLKKPSATAEHAIEFIDQQRDCLMAFVGFDHRVHIGALDGDVAFGFETRANGLFGVAF